MSRARGRALADLSAPAAEDRYRRLFEDSLTGNVVLAADGTILDCNEALAGALGIASARHLKGCDWKTLHADPAEFDALLSSLAVTDRLARHAVRLRHQEGSVRQFVANFRATFAAARVAEIHGQLFDETDRVSLEQQLRHAQKMEAIGLLAGGIAHDFNNQLTTILGFAEIIAGQIGPDKPVGRDLQEITKAARAAAALTRQLLAFSRRQVLTMTVVDFNAVVRGMQNVITRLLGEQIAVHVQLAEDLYPVVGDFAQIEQIVMNLVVNARDAMPRLGELWVTTLNVEVDAVQAKRQPGLSPGAYACIRVRDNGVGMSPEVRARIFEPFFTTKDRARGTGLGLSVVYGIVKQMGGCVSVESAVGAGTTFNICLPRSTESAVASNTRRDAVRGPDLPGRESILVVEDESSVRAFVASLLARFGYHPLVAATAEAALALLDACERPPDMVLTDVVLPGMDGRELVTRIRQQHGELRVLFMSGYSGDEEIGHWRRAMSAPLLEKPFTGHELLTRVREICDQPAPGASSDVRVGGREARCD
jgi:PAS domain S-box-containing protein